MYKVGQYNQKFTSGNSVGFFGRTPEETKRNTNVIVGAAIMVAAVLAIGIGSAFIESQRGKRGKRVKARAARLNV